VILVFALLAGWEVYGPIGAVLALPIASMIQTVFLYVRKRSNHAANQAANHAARESGMSRELSRSSDKE
jgi:predicted PurR-regulated permease PerM